MCDEHGGTALIIVSGLFTPTRYAVSKTRAMQTLQGIYLKQTVYPYNGQTDRPRLGRIHQLSPVPDAHSRHRRRSGLAGRTARSERRAASGRFLPIILI